MGSNAAGKDLVLVNSMETFQEKDWNIWFNVERKLVGGYLLQIIQDCVIYDGKLKLASEKIMKLFLGDMEE